MKFINVSTVESQAGDLVVINRNGKLVIVDEKGREQERYALTYGSHLLVHEGERGRARAASSSSGTRSPRPSSRRSRGTVEFQDIVEGENVREETDKVTGHVAAHHRRGVAEREARRRRS